MSRLMLRAKLHRAIVTEADLHYEGSCGIDAALMEAADMREFEKIELYNVNNGERFSTYIIPAPPGSGVISLNGAAARKAHVGDLLIICTYAPMSEEEARNHRPRVVLLGDGNRVAQIKPV
ncbi:aspartate 1-decarboxylase [Azohydromonas australica]|uniref:aspartate 1-decarboxylase n=1 Tax=Azohydromonas australica TaxID=364039 RepID=UPI0003F565A0|nr:aspartate 1-decarboxylase [Azohydromonas australica]